MDFCFGRKPALALAAGHLYVGPPCLHDGIHHMNSLLLLEAKLQKHRSQLVPGSNPTPISTVYGSHFALHVSCEATCTAFFVSPWRSKGHPLCVAHLWPRSTHSVQHTPKCSMAAGHQAVPCLMSKKFWKGHRAIGSLHCPTKALSCLCYN